MSANDWAKRNAGYLALAGLGISFVGFALLPRYLHNDVRQALQGDDAGLTAAPPRYAMTMRAV